MTLTRRNALKLGAASVIGLAASKLRVTPVFADSSNRQTYDPPQEEVDTFIRPTGWNVCVPYQRVAAPGGAAILSAELNLLHPSRYMTYSPNPIITTPVSGSEFIPMIYSEESWSRTEVTARMNAHPEETWLLWNEPDVATQANMTPDETASASLEFLQRAWNLDYGPPPVVNGNNFQWASGGWVAYNQYNTTWANNHAQAIRRLGISRPSYWHIHSYRSSTVSQFNSSMATFWQWYALYGSDAPVIISEICAENSSIAVQKQVMDRAAEMLASTTYPESKIDGVFWFKTHVNLPGYEDFPNAALCSGPWDSEQIEAIYRTELGDYWLAIKNAHGW